ncbi:Cyclic nucleotide-binding domain protein [Jannaschia seosinensis]|uniref:Cyclic nucleotide-binding domain protein n=1 Tax=Jannaschia seosinensis TaxID=313367 RepID=A0A0M7B6D8_9RHOB|nr:cyclic nucleotide-binding domain-containing protein [Jannaschia seosinensis]CUH22669.1 Cyclic nucleotide-binding domain protein [Jannaschia seosinensis]
MQFGVVRGQSYAYASMVIAGASCISISLLGAFNPAVLTMQIFYIVISLAGIVRLFVVSHMLRVSEEERSLVHSFLPDLPRQYVRTFLRRGAWVDLEAGEVLAEEGRPLDRLLFLTSGRAKVVIDGNTAGLCHETIIGQLTFFTGEPATATVEMEGPGRAFVLQAAPLHRLLRRILAIKLALIAGFTEATKSILLLRNREAGPPLNLID